MKIICLDSDGHVDREMQDYFHEGLLKDEQTLRDCRFSKGDRVRLVGVYHSRSMMNLSGLRVGDTGRVDYARSFELEGGDRVMIDVTCDHDSDAGAALGVPVELLEFA